MKINFKKALNGLGVDKYQVSDVLDVNINYALDLIMYENTCHELTVEEMQLIKKKFRIKASEFIEDKRRRTMKWKEIRKLLDVNSDMVDRTLGRWNWTRLREEKFSKYPLEFVEQLCDELNINFRRLLFVR